MEGCGTCVSFVKEKAHFLTNIVSLCCLEDIEAVFTMCCIIQHLVYHDNDHDNGNNDWEGKGLIHKKDMMIEYDSLDQSDVKHDPSSFYLNFSENYTSSQLRRSHISVHRYTEHQFKT